MPGISFLYHKTEDPNKKKAQILKSLDSVHLNDDYKSGILLSGPNCLLLYTSYKGYPIRTFDSCGNFYCIEGEIYNKDYSLFCKELSEAITAFQKSKSQLPLVKLLLDTDGDYVIVFFNKKRNVINIVNDSLARLPIYCYNTNENLVVSREIRFIVNQLGTKKFDEMAIAQYLLFGYPLGKRTLLKNVYRLQPSTITEIDIERSEISIKHLHDFNFEDKKYSSRSLEDISDNLVSLFCEACGNRGKSARRNVVSLSGGLDSRSVAAGLYKSNISFLGATYLDANKTALLDAKLAEQIADILKADWKLFKLSPPKGKDFLKLLRIKSGLNYLGMSFILPFFDSIKETYGHQITYFTGDVGSVLRDLRPSRKINDIDELVKYILLNKQIYSPDDVSAMTRIPKKEIISELKKHILSYPERKWDQKYVHFSIYEECLKWSFEGEDRNRFYFWSTAPLLSIPFFDFVMNCHDDLKSKNTLYRKFLLKLCPEACRINNANWNLPIVSKRLPIKLFLKSIYHRLPLQYKKIIKQCLLKNSNPYENHSNFMNCIREQLNKSEPIFDYLSRAAVEDIIKRSNKLQFNTLFTITSTIEELQCNYSTIEQYSETEFM